MKKTAFLLLLVSLISPVLSAQDNPGENPKKLTHWLTPDEMLRLHEIGRGFVETPPPAGPVRNVAEFDRMQGALVRYPFGIPVALIKEMAEDITVTTIVASTSQKNTVIQQYVNNGVDTSHCDFLIAPSDSYWTRDYGPWFVSYAPDSIAIVDFPYNRPRQNDDEIPKKVANMLGIRWFGMKVIHTGGNYMTDGMGISSSTELVWEENPTLTHEQIDQKLLDYLGIETYQVRPDPNGTYIDHIDCWGKFLAQDKILIRKVPSTHPRYSQIEAAAAFWTTQTCSYGYPYKVYRVMTPNDQPYSNSVILNDKILMPFMNSSWDDSAKAVYQAAMPGYEVIGFLGNPSTPWESTDALHCRVMGIADPGLLYINHLPLSGSQPCETDYVINADIIACSRQPVKSDSVLIWYKVNEGSFQAVLMTNTSANHYTGIIPKQPAGSTVKYYLFAADESGRNATCPLIGPADPFTFTTIFTDLTAVPDTLWFITPEDAIFGKITQLHNFTTGGVSLDFIQDEGTSVWPWFVDSISVAGLPHLMNPGDSVAVRVKMPLPVSMTPAAGFLVDSMQLTSSEGIQYVTIMINEELLSGMPELAVTTLGNGFPNPFREQTTFPFTLATSGNAEVCILDIRWLHIATLRSGHQEAGLHRVTWNGADDAGNKVPSGIYLCRLTTENGSQVRRVAVIR
jgi:agmatine/peptidylarginine deiminase